MSYEYTDESKMPFGAHKGTKLANVPAGYLMYLYDHDLKEGPLRRYIVANLDVLEQQAEKELANKNALRTMYSRKKY